MNCHCSIEDCIVLQQCCHWVMELCCSEARKSTHKPASFEEEQDLLIYNYDPVYVSKDGYVPDLLSSITTVVSSTVTFSSFRLWLLTLWCCECVCRKATFDQAYVFHWCPQCGTIMLYVKHLPSFKELPSRQSIWLTKFSSFFLVTQMIY